MQEIPEIIDFKDVRRPKKAEEAHRWLIRKKL